jgi:transposase
MLLKGSAGYRFIPGEDASRLFSPLEPAAAQEQVMRMLEQSPRGYGLPRSRWRLADLGLLGAWLAGLSAAGRCKVLRRLGISYKQALHFVTSPDPAYHDKRWALLHAFAQALAQPEAVVLLFTDELTFYRRPSLAPAYHRQGKTQPLACEVPGYNTPTRLVAALDGFSGRVLFAQARQIGKQELIRFYAAIRQAYPQTERIYLAQDNWPVHLLPEVLTAAATHRLSPLFFPTYASWLNPIEKLWRWLKQDVLHVHNLADNLDELRHLVRAFLDSFQFGSPDLLRYVGLNSILD